MKSFEKIGGKILAGILSFAVLVSPLSPAVGAMERVICDESEVNEVSTDVLDALYEDFLGGNITPERLAGIHGIYTAKSKMKSGAPVEFVIDFDRCIFAFNWMESALSLRKLFDSGIEFSKQQECCSILESISDDMNVTFGFVVNFDGDINIVFGEPISRSIVLRNGEPLDALDLWIIHKLYRSTKTTKDSGME